MKDDSDYLFDSVKIRIFVMIMKVTDVKNRRVYTLYVHARCA